MFSVSVSYALFAAPLLAFVEGRILNGSPRSFLAKQPALLRACVRPVYAAVVTVVAVFMPFFGPVVALVGAITFYPMAILVPSLVWAVHTSATRRTQLALGAYNLLGLSVSAVALGGAVAQIVMQYIDDKHVA